MARHSFVLLSFCAALMGCAGAPAQHRGPVAWDGLGQNPNLPIVTKRRVTNSASAQANPNQEREKVLGTLRPYSEAWWAVRDEIEAENDRQLGAKLVICPRCVQSPTPADDVTGSIR